MISLIKTTFRNKNYPWILLLLAFALIEHHTWINPNNLFTHTDWFSWPNAAVKELLTSYGSWFGSFNFGQPNIQINFIGFYGTWSILYHLGISYENSVWITYLVPIATLSLITPYFLSLGITKNKFLSFACSLFYGTVIYFLARQSSHLAMVFIFSLTPLIFQLLIKALDKNYFRYWAYLTLSVFVSSIYELRVTYIVVILLVAYAFYFRGIKLITSQPFKMLASVILFISMSMFWILPTLFGGATTKVSEIADSGVFGSQLFDLSHALTISDSSWTGAHPNEAFIPQHVMIYLYIIPLMAFAPFLLIRYFSRQERRSIAFFGIVALVGIFLTKESGQPLQGAYQALYSKVPGFNLYREASKFYLITGIAYLFLISYSLVGFSRFNIKKFSHIRIGTIFGICLVIIACINIIPMVNGSFSGMVTPRKIPQDYAKFNAFLDDQDTYGRTAWLPTASRWVTYNNLHPRLNLNSTVDSEWSPYIPNEDNGLTSTQRALELIQKPYAQYLFSSASIKYVVVPIRDTANDDDFIRQFGNDPTIFTNVLNKVSWLKRVNGFGDLNVYENTGYNDFATTYTSANNISDFQNFSDTFSMSNQINSSRQTIFTTSKTSNLFSQIMDVPTNTTQNNPRQNTIVSNSRKNYTYRVGGSVLSLKTINESSVNIKDPVDYTYNLTSGNNYYTFFNNQAYDLDMGGATRNIGITDNTPRFFHAEPNTSQTLNDDINNSLRLKARSREVSNCNNYGEKSDANIYIENVPSLGGQAIKLRSYVSTACVATADFPVEQGSYLFRFNYSVNYTDTLRYSIKFNTKSGDTINSSDRVEDSSGRLYSSIISVPNGATSASITLFNVPNVKLDHDSYSNFSSLTFDKVGEIQPTKNVTTSDDKNLTENNAFDYKNLINNPSLEKGLWQKTVGDCNNFDNMPEISMKLSKNQHTNGSKSLMLSSKSHNACTSPDPILIHEGAAYKFKLDYKSPNGKQIGYTISFNDKQRTRINAIVPIANTHWNTYTSDVDVPYGATSATITLYSYANYEKNISIINYYDNLALYRIPNDKGIIYSYEAAKSQVSSTQSVTSKQLNATKKVIQVKGVRNNFFLVTTDGFNTGWKLTANLNGHNADISDVHFEANSFANGWYIDYSKLCNQKNICKKEVDGTYTISFIDYYQPQKLYYVGLVISGSALVITCAGIIISIKRKGTYS